VESLKAPGKPIDERRKEEAREKLRDQKRRARNWRVER
jgi:hypothetical protein